MSKIIWVSEETEKELEEKYAENERYIDQLTELYDAWDDELPIPLCALLAKEIEQREAQNEEILGEIIIVRDALQERAYYV